MEKEKSNFHIPPGYSALESALKSYRFLKDSIGFISGNMEKYGGTYSARMPPNNQLLIITEDPEFISYVLRDNHANYHKSNLSTDRASYFLGKGLLFSNGEAWLKQRRMIQPGFHREKIQSLYENLIETIDSFLSELPTGDKIDLYPLMHELAFKIVIKSLFDIPLSEEKMTELSNNFSAVQHFFIKDINQPFLRIFYPLTGEESAILKKSKKIRQILKNIIEERRASREKYNDLLDMLLNSKYEDMERGMNDDQITDELLVLIFAGHETTANTLSWLLYLIAADNKTKAKLVNTISGSSVYESSKPGFITAVIQEAMRLYPAAWITDRVALQDDQFGKYSYPKGTIIISYFYGLHRNKDYWNKSSLFSPDRFLIEEGKEKKTKYFFPFGAGPRLCIGNNFAMAEMSFFLYSFFKLFDIKPTGQIPVMKALLTLRPDKVVLEVERKFR